MSSIMDMPDYQELIQCDLCEHYQPAREFWPIAPSGPSNTIRYFGRSTTCRHCEAHLPRTIPSAPVWEVIENLPERKSLRQRLDQAKANNDFDN